MRAARLAVIAALLRLARLRSSWPVPGTSPGMFRPPTSWTAGEDVDPRDKPGDDGAAWMSRSSPSPRDMLDEIGERAGRGVDVRDAGELGGIVADPALAAHEQHRERRRVLERHGVVAGAAGQGQHARSGALDGAAQSVG